MEKKHLRPDQPRGGARSKISSTLEEWLQIQHIWYLEEWRGGDPENSAVWFDPLQVQQVGMWGPAEVLGVWFGLLQVLRVADGVPAEVSGVWFGLLQVLRVADGGYLPRSQMFGLAC